VSLNTAVAVRVGRHRVTYQPNLSGVPDPSGLQLRVDGVLATLDPTGYDLGDGSRIAKTAAPGGLEIDFPDKSVLFVTPGWWADQSKWYLNVDVVRSPVTGGAAPGTSPPGGIAGAIVKGSWLPALPDGTSMGPMPASLHDRYVDLYQKFGNAWRVTDKTSLFETPLHPYTEALLSAVPIPRASARNRNRVILTGDVPSPINPPLGCHFHTRCPYAMARCRQEAPVLREVMPDHWASCHLHDGGAMFPLAKAASA